MTVYISGKITGEELYRARFAGAERKLQKQNFNVINPVAISENFPFLDYEKLMHIDFALLDCADAIYMLKGYEDSKGALREKFYAEGTGKAVMYE